MLSIDTNLNSEYLFLTKHSFQKYSTFRNLHFLSVLSVFFLLQIVEFLTFRCNFYVFLSLHYIFSLINEWFSQKCHFKENLLGSVCLILLDFECLSWAFNIWTWYFINVCTNHGWPGLHEHVGLPNTRKYISWNPAMEEVIKMKLVHQNQVILQNLEKRENVVHFHQKN